MYVKAISSGDTLTLRSEILRPGRELSACLFDGDDDPATRHFGAIDGDGTIIGIVSVYRNGNVALEDPNSYQVRAMATHSSCRGQGVGALLLAAAEDYAKSQGSAWIWANARRAATGFYTRAGYSLASDEFVIEGVGPHYLVTKPLM